MGIDCTLISDLHGYHPELEGGDLLIVAGDLTAGNEIKQFMDFLRWFKNQNYRKKILVSGNHDNLLMGPWPMDTKGPFREDKVFYDFDYLLDSGTEFEGLKIWGSPWTKTFKGMNPKCKAFTVDTEDELADKFEKIPHDTDILITHSPPLNVLDKTCDGRHVGSRYLHGWFRYCGRPKLHVFGHIHEAYGQGEFWMGHNNKMVISVNASHVNERYEPVNKPIRIIL